MSPSFRHSPSSSSGTIRAILASRGLSLAEISRQSRVRFAGNHLFRIPPNFYDAFRHTSFSPSLHQLFGLSVLMLGSMHAVMPCQAQHPPVSCLYVVGGAIHTACTTGLPRPYLLRHLGDKAQRGLLLLGRERVASFP